MGLFSSVRRAGVSLVTQAVPVQDIIVRQMPTIISLNSFEFST